MARWDKRVGEKLTELLAGQITQEEFQEDSEAEEIMAGEESEVMGMEGVTGGTQSSVMEVDEEENDDKVVVVEEVK